MKKVLFALLFVTGTAGAVNLYDPLEMFDAKDNFTNQSTITWRQVDNVNEVCNAERVKRGLKPFGYSSRACSFWTGNQCTIITARKLNRDTLGHEVQHCFQGSWH